LSAHATTPIRALLLDADGVVQFVPGGFMSRLAAAHGLAGTEALAFERALFALEAEAAEGRAAFAPAVAELVARLQPAIDVARLLDTWRHVEVHAGVRALVGRVRALGIRCGIATNQQDLRAGHLSGTLGYAALFDVECYSCHIGARKPQPAFFAAAIAAVGCAPADILFIDDSAANVEAARTCGLRAELHDEGSGAAGIAAALQRHGVDVR
jgi:putative hydrolase of the HAD superfamily